MPMISQEELTRIALEADEIVYRELTGAAFPTGQFQPPNAKEDCLPKFVERSEADEETMRTHFQCTIRAQRCKILELDVTEGSIGVLEDLLAPTRLQWGLKIQIKFNFWGHPYFSFLYNGVDLFGE